VIGRRDETQSAAVVLSSRDMVTRSAPGQLALPPILARYRFDGVVALMLSDWRPGQWGGDRLEVGVVVCAS
jgi:hypothetical protein